ncbi:hypothetical protein KFU94_03340 [Chloroflexi bacterium TSY]|nr:hypothetical protein [Chloroflexi bacterium TSY]
MSRTLCSFTLINLFAVLCLSLLSWSVQYENLHVKEATVFLANAVPASASHNNYRAHSTIPPTPDDSPQLPPRITKRVVATNHTQEILAQMPRQAQRILLPLVR